MNRILLMCLFLTLTLVSNANVDSLFVKIGSGNHKFFEHQIQPGQTLFNLSQTYYVPVQSIHKYNPSTANTPLAIGQSVLLPAEDSMIVYEKYSTDTFSFKPIYITVKEGVTLFSLARVFFDTSVDAIKAKNTITNNILSPGQVIHIGWLKVNADYYKGLKSLPKFKTIEQEENIANETIYIGLDSFPEIQQNGASAILKGKSINSLYVLHRTASPGTIVKIGNPFNGHIVFAKVLGTIPSVKYSPYDIVVISEKVAELLGQIDHRINVSVTFHNEK